MRLDPAEIGPQGIQQGRAQEKCGELLSQVQEHTQYLTRRMHDAERERQQLGGVQEDINEIRARLAGVEMDWQDVRAIKKVREHEEAHQERIQRDIRQVANKVDDVDRRVHNAETGLQEVEGTKRRLQKG